MLSDILQVFTGLKRIVRPGDPHFSRSRVSSDASLARFHLEDAEAQSMRSPRCIDRRIASNTASTATSALTLVMSAIFEPR